MLGLKSLYSSHFTHCKPNFPEKDDDIRAHTSGNYDQYAARVNVCSSDQMYEIKHLTKKQSKSSRQNKEADYLGETNLVLEAKYLSKFNHPHIIKLCATNFEQEAVLAHDSRHDAFFIVTNMIVETLADRIGRWKDEDASEFTTKGPLFKKKMAAMKGIASALQYLHERNIMLINLNPQNIGFLEDGSIQLFDLSTCREVPQSSTIPKQNDFEVSQLSFNLDDDSEEQVDARNEEATTNRKLMPAAEHGIVPRYMAPEVVTQGKYTLKCDVYSFSMVAYHILTLSTPFPKIQPGQHLLKVCFEAKRPSLGTTGIPKNLQALLSRSWRHDPHERLSMTGVMKGIRSLNFDKRSSTNKKGASKDRSGKSNESTSSSSSPQRPGMRRGGLERGSGGTSTRRGLMSSARGAKSMRGNFDGRASAMRREKSMRADLMSQAQHDVSAGTTTPGRPQRRKLTRGMVSDRNLMGIIATPKGQKKKALQLRREASVRDF